MQVQLKLALRHTTALPPNLILKWGHAKPIANDDRLRRTDREVIEHAAICDGPNFGILALLCIRCGRCLPVCGCSHSHGRKDYDSPAFLGGLTAQHQGEPFAGDVLIFGIAFSFAQVLAEIVLGVE